MIGLQLLFVYYSEHEQNTHIGLQTIQIKNTQKQTTAYTKTHTKKYSNKIFKNVFKPKNLKVRKNTVINKKIKFS